MIVASLYIEHAIRERLSSERLRNKLMILHVGSFGEIGHQRWRVVLGNKIVEIIEVAGAEVGSIKKDVSRSQRPSSGKKWPGSGYRHREGERLLLCDGC